MTPKQKLQRDRAYFKFVLSGIPKPIKLESLSEIEQLVWKEMLSARKALLDMHDECSIELGLNIPEHRCWCGKPAKVQVDYYGAGELQWVCNKHINND